MKRWAGIAAAVMLGMSLSLTGCGKAVNKGPSAPLVKTIVIGEDAKDAKDTFSGTVHGFFESPLAFQTGGRIMQRYVTSGERGSCATGSGCVRRCRFRSWSDKKPKN